MTVSDSWVLLRSQGQYDIELQNVNDIKNQDAIIIAVCHREYINFLKKYRWQTILRPNGVVIDVKSIFNENYFSKLNFKYWAL